MKFDDLHDRWMRDDPEYRVAYAASEEEFALASALIGARVDAGLTQEELARCMGTSQAQIARMESGRYLPSSRTLQRLAEATGTRLRISFESPADSGPAAARGQRRARSDQQESGVSLSDATLRAVQALGESATANDVMNYLSREFGMPVRPNHLGMALQRHRRAGRLENRDQRWYVPAKTDA